MVESVHMDKHVYFLGIDGGGTKTHFALADQDGNILARAKTGQMNVHNASEKEIKDHLKQGWRLICEQAHITPATHLAGIAAGLAGLDAPQDFAEAKQVFAAFFKRQKPRHVTLVNDTVIGLFAGSQEKNAIAVIGGTGSNCYGHNARGKQAWAGGLDYLLSDEGSGYEMGVKALKASAKSADGRGPKTKLESMILKHFRVKTIRELIPLVYGHGFGKFDIGQIALLVEKAALAGDKIAKQIAQEAANELLLLVRTVAQKLAFTKSTVFDVVMIGGVLQHDPIVTRVFKKGLKISFPKARPIIPQSDPVMGAVRLALAADKGKLRLPHAR